MSRIKKHFFIIFYLLFYFAINAYKLISHALPFFDWDEAIYTQVGREMIANNSLVPLWQGMPWLDKPPLVPLFYGLVEKIFFFVEPEISLRLATLSVAVITLFFVYLVLLRSTKSRLIASLSVVITSFVSIFLQRSTAVNIDVFLLLGWLGYLLFFENFYLSLFFLSLSVLSKTLVGFYPAAVIFGYHLYLLLAKKIKREKFNLAIKKIITQVLLLSIWYLIMFILYGKAFWTQHIVETHFKRVTSSIEFHFGKRTFYLDLIFEQFGRFAWIGYASLALLIVQFVRKKLNETQLLFGMFLLPWFIFLNLTKTKIFWYAYPVIPLFAFLIAYPLTFIKLKSSLFKLLGSALILIVIYWAIISNNFFQTYYSSFEPHYYLATYAKNVCDSLSVLENKDNRIAFATLEKMNLLITSSKWWGSHPSIVYYFGKNVNFLYSTSQLKNDKCVAVEKGDLDLMKNQMNYKLLKIIDPYYLFIKSAKL